MDISFVLVEPAYPGNIGSAARALNTMGFENLVLVNSVDHLVDEAKWLAHGSIDILENAVILSSFDEVIPRFDFIIGTSAKKRSVKNDLYLADEIPGILKNKKPIAEKIAIVFGREESGLTNKELEQCDLISTIPIRKKYPSINLAQSVMIYTYLLSDFNFRYQKPECRKDENILEILRSQLSKSLEILEIDKNENLSNRIRERVMAANADDIHLILSVCNRITEKLAK